MDRARKRIFPRPRARLRIPARPVGGHRKGCRCVRQGDRPDVGCFQILQRRRRQQGRQIGHLLRLPLGREPSLGPEDRNDVGQILCRDARRRDGAARIADHDAGATGRAGNRGRLSLRQPLHHGSGAGAVPDQRADQAPLRRLDLGAGRYRASAATCRRSASGACRFRCWSSWDSGR